MTGDGDMPRDLAGLVVPRRGCLEATEICFNRIGSLTAIARWLCRLHLEHLDALGSKGPHHLLDLGVELGDHGVEMVHLPSAFQFENLGT